MNELSTSLVAQINTAHAKCVDAANVLAGAALCSINAARETGVYLIALDEQTPHGEWLKLFPGRSNSKPACNFSHETGRLYMKLARAIPEPLTELPQGIHYLKDMLIAVEALPAPSGHGEQTRHEPQSPFMAIVKFSGELQGRLSEWTKADPVDQWTIDRREQVKSQLEPVVKFYETL